MRIFLLIGLAGLMAGCKPDMLTANGEDGSTTDLATTQGIDGPRGTDLSTSDLQNRDLANADMSASSDLSVTADFSLSPDLALPGDMAPPTDYAFMPDSAIGSDLAVRADLAMLPDLGWPGDLLPAPDLAKLVDLANADLARLPDLAPPADLTMGIVQPDLAFAADLALPPPDLALPSPDLTVPLPDLATGADMMNPFPALVPPISPTVKHVGAAAPTCCIVTHPSGHALYLANFNSANQVGDLHLVDSAGTDTSIQGKSAPILGYDFTSDGKYAYYLGPSITNQDALRFVEVANPQNNTAVIAAGVQAGSLRSVSFVTPSKNYLIIGVQPSGVANSLDMHVVDLVARQDIYSAFGQGAFDYLETVTDLDLMFFQNIVGGNNPMTPGVNTLFSVPLGGLATGAQPTTIDTHTGSIYLTPDYKTLVYNKTNGSLWRYDIAQQKVTAISSSGPNFGLGTQPQGPIGYVSADLSVHVTTFTQDVWSAPAGSSDLFSYIYFSPDGSHVYFYKNVDSQDSRGDLYEGALPPLPAAPPRLIATSASLTMFTSGNHIFYYANVPVFGLLGDLTSANLDGSGAVQLGTTSLVGQLAIPRAGYTPVYSALTPGTIDPNTGNHPVDGSPASWGGLGFSRSPIGPLLMLDGSVHADTFHYDDTRRLLVYAGASAWSAPAVNYAGALKLFDIASGNATSVGLNGVSEIGAITNRALFVNAPTANPAGIYYVTY